MAIYKVYHGSSAPGTPWDDFEDNAFTDIADAIAEGVLNDGDVLLLAHDHNAAYSGGPTVSHIKSIRCISVNRTTEVYQKGANECVSSGSGAIALGAHDVTVVYKGIVIGSDSGTSQNCVVQPIYRGRIEFIDCDVDADTSADSGVRIGSTNKGSFLWQNCDFYLPNSANGKILLGGAVSSNVFRACSFPNALSSDAPLFSVFSSPYGIERILVEDSDISKFKYIAAGPGTLGFDVLARRCDLHATLQAFTTSPGPGDRFIAEYCAQGSVSDTPMSLNFGVTLGLTNALAQPTIYRTGYDGSRNWAYQMISNANCGLHRREFLPLEGGMLIWHDASASKTLSVFVLCDNGSMTDDMFGVDVSYQDSANPAYGTGEFLTTQPGYLGAVKDTSTYLKSDGSSWYGGGGYYVYKFSVGGIAPKEPGWVTVRPWLAAASTNLWICPDMSLTP